MAQYDGKVTISTALDNTGLKKGINDISGELGGMKSVLSKLGAAVAAAFAVGKIIEFGKASVVAANELSDALIGLQSIMEGQGRSFSQAQQFIEDYTKDGLIPATNTINAYKNLALRGYDDSQIRQVMTALKDSAAFGRQASYTMGEAVQTASEGLKNENSILVDNAGVTKNVAQMWKEYAASIGTSSDKLSQEQKIQAEVNGILEETKFQTGDAAKMSGQYSGQVAALTYNMNVLKVAVGNAIKPLLQAVLPAINAIIAALTKLANLIATVTGALFGKVTVTSSGLAAGNDAIADSAGTAADAEQALASGTAAATKEAKKSLATFDELNQLQDNTADSGSGSSRGSGGTATGGSTITATAEVEGQTIPKLEAAISAFKQGFADALATASTGLAGLQTEMERCGKAWAAIWNDSAVQDASTRFVTSLAEMLGKLTGSLASIGLSAADNFFGGLEIYLNSSAAYIKKRLVGLFDVGAELADLAGGLAMTISTVFSSVGSEGGKALTSGIIGTAISTLLGMVESFGRTLFTVLAPVFQPIIDNAGLLRDTLSDLFALIAPLFQGMAKGVAEFYDGLLAVFDVLQPVIDLVSGFVSGTLNVALTILNALLESLQVFAPVLDGIGEVLGYVAGGFTATVAVITALNAASAALSAVWGLLTTAAGALAGAVGLLTSPFALAAVGIAAVIALGVALYRNWDTVKAAATVFVQAVGEAFSGWASLMQETLIGIRNYFSDIWADITMGIYAFLDSVLAALQQWIKNVQNDVGSFLQMVTTAWQTVQTVTTTVWASIASVIGSVWTGIVSTIKGCINAILGAINGMISGIVAGLNSVVSALNGLSFEIPNWVPALGGKTFGFSIGTLTAPQIPYLAQGAVIPPNREFLAVLGDQRSGTNVEAPLATIQQAVADVNADSIAAMMAGFEALRDELAALRDDVQAIRIGDDTLGRSAGRYNHRIAMMQGV